MEWSTWSGWRGRRGEWEWVEREEDRMGVGGEGGGARIERVEVEWKRRDWIEEGEGVVPRQKIMVKLPLIIEIIDKSYPYNTDKIWIPMSAYYGKLLPINYG